MADFIDHAQNLALSVIRDEGSGGLLRADTFYLARTLDLAANQLRARSSDAMRELERQSVVNKKPGEKAAP